MARRGTRQGSRSRIGRRTPGSAWASDCEIGDRGSATGALLFSPATRTNVGHGPKLLDKQNARGMLDMLNRGESLPEAYRSSIAMWRFGDELTLVGLPGEAVADYVPRIREALGPVGLWIAAYCNESFGYLPTAEILEQGGHESMGLTLAVGLFSPQVEGTVIDSVRRLAEETRP